VRERAALLHEQITDLRAEQLDQRSLYIAVVAFIAVIAHAVHPAGEPHGLADVAVAQGAAGMGSVAMH